MVPGGLGAPCGEQVGVRQESWALRGWGCTGVGDAWDHPLSSCGLVGGRRGAGGAPLPPARVRGAGVGGAPLRSGLESPAHPLRVPPSPKWGAAHAIPLADKSQGQNRAGGSVFLPDSFLFIQHVLHKLGFGSGSVLV